MFELLGGVVIGIVISTAAGYIMFNRAARRAEADFTELIAAAIQEQERNTIPARVEQHDGMYYVYNLRDDSFLAQGSTLLELKNRLESRVKNAHVFVTEGDADVLERLKATQSDVETTNA